jgi:type IX secretion system PorP/SprF family membrane protein
MNKFILILVFPFLALFANAQQDPQFSQYIFNNLSVNPGYAGSNNAICATGLNRTQWIGFEGAPTSTNLSVEAPISSLHGGLGLNVLTEKIGNNQILGLNLAYSYRKSLTNGDLGIGLSIGVFQSGIEENFKTEEAGDFAIPVSGDKASTIDLGFGLHYKSEKLYVGLSTKHLNEGSLASATDILQLKRHYYLTSGYFYSINENFDLTPSLFVKTDGVTASLDVTSILEYNKKLWGGVSYRPSFGAILLLGMHLNKDLKFGVSYDVPISDVSESGSLEFMLGYCFEIDYNKLAKGYKNPRFL